MARNSEKAQSMLFRFREAQAADLGIIDAGRSRRPKNISSVTTIPECEKWRGQVLKDISRKVSRVHDPSLSDYQIRDLNDEVNKHMREKHVWEVQIRNLGGPNYMRGPGGAGRGGAGGGRFDDTTGREIPGGGKGYRYFGRAKDLPGVKELFDSAKASAEAAAAAREEKPLAKREDLRKRVDAGYYGYNVEEEDDALLLYEAQKERVAFETMVETGNPLPPAGWEPLPGDVGDGRTWELPTLEEVQAEMVDRRKRRLLQQFSGQ